MKSLNHFALSSILGSEIVGPFKAGHGRIDSLGDAQRYFDLLEANEPPSVAHDDEAVDINVIKDAFLELREELNDRGSPDLYVADPGRNATFLEKCYAAGATASPFAINKALLRARQNGQLSGLNSVRTKIENLEEIAFAVEFAATELKYRAGASIDDIICDPDLAAQFDTIAMKITPGREPLDYRWAILSIRKAGRNREDFRVPELRAHVPLVKGSLNAVPDTTGVFLLSEKERPLYVRGTDHLRHGIELLRKPTAISAMTDKFWKPDFDLLVVNYAVVPKKGLVKPVEQKIIEDKRPIFNVSRQAA
jgi:hypothetical protein